MIKTYDLLIWIEKKKLIKNNIYSNNKNETNMIGTEITSWK